MATLTLELPWPPSVNHYWRATSMGVRGRRGCRVVLSREGRAYRKEVCARLAAHQLRPLTGRLHLSVVLHPPTRRAIDIDNRMKGLLDSLAHAGVYRDDGQIDRLHIDRGEVTKGGKAVVEIVELLGGVGTASA